VNPASNWATISRNLPRLNSMIFSRINFCIKGVNITQTIDGNSNGD
jgi:hypothetical protein